MFSGTGIVVPAAGSSTAALLLRPETAEFYQQVQSSVPHVMNLQAYHKHLFST